MARTKRPGTHPAVKAATPRWMVWTAAAIAWAEALATAGVFVVLGLLVDSLADAGAVASGRVTWAIGLAVLAAVLAGVGVWFAQWAGAATEKHLRADVTRGTFALGITHPDSGARLSLATEAVERAAHYRAGFLGPIVAAMTAPLLVLALMAATVDGAIAGWLALLLLLVPLLIGGFQRTVSPIGKMYRETQGRLTGAFLEALQAIETLVYARAAKRARDDLATVGEEYRRSLMSMLARNQLLILVTDTAFSLAIVVSATWLAASRVMAGTLTIGQGIAILLMTVLVTGPVDVIGRFFYIGIGGRAAVRQISEHLVAAGAAAPRHPARSEAESQDPGRHPDREVLDSPTTRGTATDAGAVSLQSVTVGWPDGPDVVRDFSLSVAPGERVALVGPSGAGKSTISALIQGHVAPRSGTLTVDGLTVSARTGSPRGAASSSPSSLSEQELSQLPTAESVSAQIEDVKGAELRARLAVVEQRTFLFIGSIAENLRIARPSASDSELWEALDLAGLRRDVEAMPLGLDTPVGEHGTLLSGGQAQRLSIARAALRDAPILILDEPTSQVDLAGEAAILAALDRLAEGRTVLMIAHRPGAILAADRVVEVRG